MQNYPGQPPHGAPPPAGYGPPPGYGPPAPPPPQPSKKASKLPLVLAIGCIGLLFVGAILGTLAWYGVQRYVERAREAASASPPGPSSASNSTVSRSLLVADVPAGYTRVSADMPGLDAETRAMIEAGDIFLADESREGGALIAHARAGTGHAVNQADCTAVSGVMAKAMGATLVSAEVVALPFGKACRTDMRFSDSKLIARSLQWDLSKQLSVLVSCNPFEEGKPSGDACMRFAASVRAK